ncbi:lactoylglutathione lyase [Saccharopolyspora antimicrobica]|uniref:Lactoylglutathione lyase n=1 Tax=Saccharopolyspora antimicrobica TaxID=455193 RepID=A0A1I5G9Q4_9PSEU|nr:VOC family protein [Saccharopolyspora antimicrobica]RKT83862.1 lactoylglutathione lyase [Saccharopolyspora antimicrobica]SFO32609.1 lactoylglutathione lyase [Saccharopolyspora antimicrobica]
MYRDAFPILSGPDLDRAMRFYRDLLGFQPEYRFPAEGDAQFVTLRSGDLKLGLAQDATAGLGEHFALWLYTDDVDRAVAELREAGTPVRREPQDMPWGERVATVADPDGNSVHIGATRR